MSEGTGQVDPTRLPVEQAAKLLSAAYRERIDQEKIRLDLENGAPVNVDGTINLVHYSAWQAKEMGRGD
jgi:argininosuccinate synthase